MTACPDPLAVKVDDAPSLAEIYDELHNALFRLRSLALVGMNACGNMNGSDMSGFMGSMFNEAHDAFALIESSGAAFGYDGDLGHGGTR